MSAVFLKIVNMSITAGWIVLAIMLLRLLLMKAPKWIRVVLWGFVALRLVCPVSIESIFSLIPSVQTLPSDLTSGPSFNIDSGVSLLNHNVNEYLDSHYFEGVTVPANNARNVMGVLTVVWIVGIVAMLVYALFSFLRVQKRVQEAVWIKENVWVCDQVATPFILGVIRPRIYLPSSMNEEDMRCVLNHEKAHLKRRDHIWKPFGFLLLAVYWFNPILWVGYVFLCRDIELACDEKVLKELGNGQKKSYAEALVSCSAPRKLIAACPLAFGENSVKQRVKSILNYKKPAFWIVIVTVLVCVVAGVCLLTNPKAKANLNIDEMVDQEVLYRCKTEKDTASITFSSQNNQCSFSYSMLSSYHGTGIYEERDNMVVVKTAANGTVVFVFYKQGVDLILVAGASAPIPSFRYSADAEPEPCLADGARFEYIGRELVGNVRFHYNYGSALETATLSLSPGSKSWSFLPSTLSSVRLAGSYEEDGGYVRMKIEGEGMYTFKKRGKTLVFVEGKSSSLEEIPDGAVFKLSKGK